MNQPPHASGPPSGPGAPNAMAMHPQHPLPHQHQSRRHQEYQHYNSQPPRSPGPYAMYHHMQPQQFYNQYSQMPYPSQRWPYPQYPQYPQMSPHQPLQYSQHYTQRPPMIVSSQPVSPHQPTRPHLQSYHSNLSQTSSTAPNDAAATAAAATVRQPRQSLPKPSVPQPASGRSSPSVQSFRTTPFYPKLPWYCPPEARDSFPPRSSRQRRKRQNLHRTNDAISLPSRTAQPVPVPDLESSVESIAATGHSEQEQSKTPSEHDRAAAVTSPKNGAVKSPLIPITPVVPALTAQRPKSQADSEPIKTVDAPETSTVQSGPKSWADLVRSKASNTVNTNGSLRPNGAQDASKPSLAETLDQFRIENQDRTVFLKPHGLVNTGNMCYMNSILQVLIFCGPFYDFLDRIARQASHSFQSDTPLIDAMIMFMREFEVLDSADSVEQLRLRLKPEELEQYGQPFTPEYVYEAIKRLPRFSTMRRGHQQDAEEFLGFLLAGMHDECALIQRSKLNGDHVRSESSTTDNTESVEDGWLEVGPKQRAAITRQSGDTTLTTPITRVFGGTLRSELRVPGNKISVTLEPYQPLQLDIGAPDVNNIQDALTGLTKPESLTGAFSSPRGPGTTATKQVFIETLPPVLMLHLKRFQYDSSGGTQKIWKRIGYPLELEIPKAVFSSAKRGAHAQGLPRYRLIAVVYHHGKSAAGGHYTVDILRQDRREWIRMDDTVIRRIRPEEVAEGGAEDGGRVSQHQTDHETTNKTEESEERQETDWSQVNGVDTRKRGPGVAAPANVKANKTSPRKDGKDSKVAYILLYEKMT